MPDLDLNTLYFMAKTGDHLAEELLFQTLRERFRPIAQRRLCGHVDSEDVIQETLIAISETYRLVEIDRSFVAWAHAILKNKIANYHRTSKRRSQWVVSYEVLPEASFPSHGPDRGAGRVLDCLKMVAKENQRYARALSLCYQGYRTEEICSMMHVTRNNLYVILYRARALLRRCLEDNGGRHG